MLRSPSEPRIWPNNVDVIVCEAGLRKIGWHALRHTFASHLVMRGAPIKAVQELLGHASPVTTRRYVQLPAEAMRRTVAAVAAAG